MVQVFKGNKTPGFYLKLLNFKIRLKFQMYDVGQVKYESVPCEVTVGERPVRGVWTGAGGRTAEDL